MTFRTEDQVRNQAGITLGFIDAKGNNVETTDYLSGVGQVTSFIQLGTKLGTSDFMGISDKPDGWFLPFNQNGVAIVLETKSEKEVQQQYTATYKLFGTAEQLRSVSQFIRDNGISYKVIEQKKIR